MSGLWVDAEAQLASVNLERARSLEVVGADMSRRVGPEDEAALIATFDGGTWYTLSGGTFPECQAERVRLVGLLRQIP